MNDKNNNPFKDDPEMVKAAKTLGSVISAFGDEAKGRSPLIKPIIAWYDLWVGIYYDRKRRKLYFLPIPCVGIVIDLAGVSSNGLVRRRSRQARSEECGATRH